MNRKGTTLVEMMIALACFAAVAFAVTLLIQQTNVSSEYLNGQNQLIQWGQKAIDEINFNLGQARVNYQNDTMGNVYWGRMQVDAAYPKLTSTRLACIDQTGSFHLDIAPATRTGNALLFLRESTPFIANIGGITRSVSTYALIGYYLSSTANPISKKASSLRLVCWQSREFADYAQVMTITPSVSRSIFANALLASRGIDHFLVPKNNPTVDAFYEFDDDDAGDADNDDIDDAPDSGYIIQKDTVSSVVGNLGQGRAAVSWNKDNNFWVPDPVPKFGALDITGDGFPHGLEVQMVGPTGARQVFVRLVLAYYVSLNQAIFSSEFTTISTMHEF
ncbi:MAG: prepilin-type N-terminal cleavage/methylation domain-containing protein [Planctomycetota bacterium]